MTLTVGSLFSGYEGLGLALGQVLNTELAWVCDNDPAASKVLAHRYPNVPNLGDITAVDWDQVEPVDIICGGSPCQDVSMAGRRLGMKPDTRSGLWTAMATAIDLLRPQLVIFENVRGILSAEAHCDLEPCPWHLGGSCDGEPALRALGRVLGDLADIGFDAEWTGLRASDIGAPHHRHREFLLAWPSGNAAHAADFRRQRGGAHGDGGLDLRTAIAGLPHPDVAVGGERRVAAPGQAEGGGARPDARGRGGASDPVAAGSVALGVGSTRPTPRATDGTNGGPNQRGSSGDLMLPSAVAQLLPTPAARDWRSGQSNLMDTNARPLNEVIVNMLPTPTVADSRDTANFRPDGTPYGAGYGTTLTDAARLLPGAVELLPTPTATPYGNNQSASPNAAVRPSLNTMTDWGPFAAAVARWEHAIGRPAPNPTEPGKEGKPRLSPVFVEWMLGLDAGWVTDVPDLSRNDLLRILGNGVVPQQGAAAIRALLAAVPRWGTGQAGAA